MLVCVCSSSMCVCVLILPMKPGNFGGRKKTDFYIVSCLLSDLSNESRCVLECVFECVFECIPLLQIQFILLLRLGTPSLAARVDAADAACFAVIAERRILYTLVDLVRARTAARTRTHTRAGTVAITSSSTGAHAHALGSTKAIAFVVRWWTAKDHVRIGYRATGACVLAPIARGLVTIAEDDVHVGLLRGCKDK